MSPLFRMKKVTPSNDSPGVDFSSSVSETRAQGGSLKKLSSYMLEKGLLVSSLVAGQFLLGHTVLAGPQGGVVVSGQGSVNAVSATETLINQKSQNLLMNFSSFDVASNESVTISQPNSSSWFVAKILGGSPTSIFGSVSANGQLAFINPRGVLFGESATIDASSIFASALLPGEGDIFEQSNNFTSDSETGGMVVNQGLIQASIGGSVTLLGKSVSNEGVILATLGQVNLSSGRSAVVSFGPENLLGVEVTEAVLDNHEDLRAAVNNSGTIDAEGGQVLLSGEVSRDLFDHAVNNEGVIRANSGIYENGVIKLVAKGSDLINTGTLDVSNRTLSGTAGNIEISGDKSVHLTGDSSLVATADNGQGGVVVVQGESLLLDGNGIVDASGSTGGGKIELYSTPITMGDTTDLHIAKDVILSVNADTQGDGGQVYLEGVRVQVNASIDAKGGLLSGAGGSVVIKGEKALGYAGKVDASAPNGLQGTLTLVSEGLTITDEGKNSIAAASLEESQANLEFQSSSRIEITDLSRNQVQLGKKNVSLTVTGEAGALENEWIGFVMSGENDRLSVEGSLTVQVTDTSANANALIDIAGSIESLPAPPRPDQPDNPYDISLIANDGRIRVRSTGFLKSVGPISLADDSLQPVAGGSILLQATGYESQGEGGTLLIEGTLDASSQLASGGSIKMLGDRVAMSGKARADVSGLTGGGVILLGGNYQGQGAEINAQKTFVGTDVNLVADAIQRGSGGKIIVWSDESTRFYGSVSARGGIEQGDGGFVEISGKHLDYAGEYDLSVTNGKVGTLLFDPQQIEIRGGNGDGDDDDGGTTTFNGVGNGEVNFDDATGTATFSVRESELANASANIILQATDGITTFGNFGADGLVLGNNISITLQTRNASGEGSTGIDLTGSNTFKITASGTGSINIFSGTDGGDTGTATLIVPSLVATGSGSVSLGAEGQVTVEGDITVANAGTINISGENVQVNDGVNLSSASGAIAINAGTGALNLIDGAGSRSTINTTNAAITITADDLIFGTNDTADQIIAGGGNSISLINSSASLTMGVGGGAGSFSLSDAELAELDTSGTILIGSSTAGAIILDTVDMSTISGTTDLSLVTGATVNDVGAGAHVTADVLTIVSGTGVGTTSTLNTEVTTLDVTNSTNGVIDITETDALTLSKAVQMTSGTIDISAGGLLGISGSVTTLGSDGLSLTGAGVTVDTAVTVSSVNGLLSVDAGTGVLTLSDSAGPDRSVLSTSNADITLTADDLVIGTLDGTNADQVVAGGGNTISLVNSSVILSMGIGGGAGSYSVSDAELAELDTSGTVVVGSITAGAIVLDTVDMSSISATTDLTLLTGATVNDAGAGTHVTADVLTIASRTGVGISSTLNTNVAALDVTNSVFGKIDITESDALTVTQVVQLPGGDIILTGGDLLIGVISTSGTATLSSTGSINDLTTDAVVDITAATIDLNATTSIGGTRALELAGEVITADTTDVITGVIDLDNEAATTSTVTLNTAGAGNISFDQTGSQILGLTATSANGEILASNTGASLLATSITANGASNIALSTFSAGDVLVASVDATGDQVQINSAGGIQESTATDAAVDIVAATIDLSAGNSIGGLRAIELAGSTVTADTIDVTTGVIDLDNTASTTSTVTLSTAGAGDINFDQTGNQILDLTASSTNGDIVVTNTGGDLLATNISAIGANNVSLSTVTSGNLLIDSIAVGGQIQLNAAENIEESLVTDTAVDLSATGIDLNANASIGGARSLEVSGSNIAADTVSLVSGVINLGNVATSSSTVTLSTAGAGSINFDQTGNQVLDMTAVSASGEIVASNTGADFLVTSVVAGGAGNVTLDTVLVGDVIVDSVSSNVQVQINSVGSIDESTSVDTLVDVSAATIDLNASTGVGGNRSLELSGQIITADTTSTISGIIDLDNTATTTSTVTLNTAGAGDISFDQTGSQQLNVSGSSSNGLIAVTNTGADLQADQIIAGGSGDIVLSTLSLGDIQIGEAIALSDQVQVTSAGALNDLSVDVLTDITASQINLTAASGIGNIQVLELAGSVISADTTSTTTGIIDLVNLSSASSSVTLTMAGSGDIDFSQSGGGSLSISTNSPGGSVLLVSDASVDLGNLSVSSDLAVTAMGSIYDSGTLQVGGETRLDTGGLVIGANDIVLDSAANDFNDLVISQAGDASVRDIDDVRLGDATVNGIYEVTAGGQVEVFGTIITDTLRVDTSSSGTGDLIKTAAASISVNLAQFDIGRNVDLQSSVDIGTLEVTALDVTLIDLGMLNIGVSDVGGTLDVLVQDHIDIQGTVIASDLILSNAAGGTGGISQSAGTLSVTGNAVIASAFDVNLNQLNEFAGLVGISGAAIGIQDASSLQLGEISATGNVSISSIGLITGAERLSVGGELTLDAGGNFLSANAINLNNSTNDISSVNIINAGNTSIVSSGNLALSGANVSGEFSVQSRDIDVSGIVQSASLVLSVSGISGSVTESTGSIDVSGLTTINVGVSSDVQLNSANDFGSVSISQARNVTLRDINSMTLGAGIVSGDLSVSTGGDLDSTGALSVLGLTTLDVTGAGIIDLLNSSNDFSQIAIASADSVNIVDSNSLLLSGTVTNNLSAMVLSGDIANGTTGSLSVGGSASFVATSGQVSLENVNNNFSDLSIQAQSVIVAEVDDLRLTGLDVANGMSLTLGGTVSQDVFSRLRVGDELQITSATGEVDLGGTDNQFGSVVFTAAGINLRQVGSIVVGNLTTPGDVSVEGSSVDLTTDFVAGSLAMSAALVNLGGAAPITITTTTGDISITGQGAIPRLVLSSSVSFDSQGDVNLLWDSGGNHGSLDVLSGITGVDLAISAAGDIGLGNTGGTNALNSFVVTSGNNFSSGALNAVGDILVGEYDGINLVSAMSGIIGVDGNVISQSGNINFISNGDISLMGATNAVNGRVLLFSDTGSIFLDRIDAQGVAGQLDVIAEQSININGDISLSGGASIYSELGSIGQAQNTLLTAGTIYLSAGAGMSIADLVSTNNDIIVNVTSSGAILRSNAIDDNPDISSAGSVYFFGFSSQNNSVQLGEVSNPFNIQVGSGRPYFGFEGEFQVNPESASAFDSNNALSLLEQETIKAATRTSFDDIFILDQITETGYIASLESAFGNVAERGISPEDALRTTAAAQTDEEEVAELDEAAFQDLRNYDENPNGILLPEDQYYAQDVDGNIYYRFVYQEASLEGTQGEE